MIPVLVVMMAVIVMASGYEPPTAPPRFSAISMNDDCHTLEYARAAESSKETRTTSYVSRPVSQSTLSRLFLSASIWRRRSGDGGHDDESDPTAFFPTPTTTPGEFVSWHPNSIWDPLARAAADDENLLMGGDISRPGQLPGRRPPLQIRPVIIAKQAA